MEITRRQDLEDVLYEQLIRSFAEPLAPVLVPGESVRGKEVHLSDLMNPRQAAFKRLLPMAVTRREANLFMTGRGFEFDLARRTKLIKAPSRVIEGISMSPDFTEWPGHWKGVIEVKWRRANLAPAGEEASDYENYLDQIRGYCGMMQYDRALLIVATPRQGQQYNDDLAPTEPAIHVLEVVFTTEELEQAVQVLRQRRDQFSAALERRDPSQVALCYDWLCGTRKKVVDAKPFCKTCNKEFATEYGIDKHLNAKTGAGHDVVHETVHFEYEPRCRWYSFCQPEKVDPARGATHHGLIAGSVSQPGEHPAVGGTPGPQGAPQAAGDGSDVATQGAPAPEGKGEVR